MQNLSTLVSLQNVQQQFETEGHILQLLLSTPFNGNRIDSKITELNMNHQT